MYLCHATHILRVSQGRVGVWPEWVGSNQAKQQKVSSRSARRNSHARQHRNTNLYASSWREGGISCHIKFPQRTRRWGMSPHSNPLHTQQVLTSRLTLDRCESNSSGRHCLIRMHPDSLYPIPGFWGSQVLPLICWPVNQRAIRALLQWHWIGSWLGLLTLQWLGP